MLYIGRVGQGSSYSRPHTAHSAFVSVGGPCVCKEKNEREGEGERALSGLFPSRIEVNITLCQPRSTTHSVSLLLLLRPLPRGPFDVYTRVLLGGLPSSHDALTTHTGSRRTHS